MFVCIYMYVCMYIYMIYIYPMYISTQATGNPRVRPLTFPVAPWPVRAVQVHRKDGSGASGRGLQSVQGHHHGGFMWSTPRYWWDTLW